MRHGAAIINSELGYSEPDWDLHRHYCANVALFIPVNRCLVYYMIPYFSTRGISVK